MSDSQPITLAYWNIRGLAEPCRMLLNYAGVDFVDKVYNLEQNEDGSWSRQGWLNEKFTLGLDLPNLPYLIDPNTGLKITQSNAILRYVARLATEKTGHPFYNAADAKHAAYVDMFLDEAMDWRNKWVTWCYGRDTGSAEDRENQYKPTILPKLQEWDALLENRTYIAGDSISAADFHFIEMTAQHLEMFPTLLDAVPNYKAYYLRVWNDPKVQDYVQNRRVKRGSNNLVAKFGAAYAEEPKVE